MLLKDEKTVKRFLICYKKQIDGELKKNIKAQYGYSEKDAILRFLNKENIMDKQIDRDMEMEGWIYCNEIYNPQTQYEKLDGI